MARASGMDFQSHITGLGHPNGCCFSQDQNGPYQIRKLTSLAADFKSTISTWEATSQMRKPYYRRNQKLLFPFLKKNVSTR